MMRDCDVARLPSSSGRRQQHHSKPDKLFHRKILRSDTIRTSINLIENPYGRIEDAHYARNAGVRASARGRAPAAIVCQTLDEFIVKSTGREMLAAA